MNVGFELGWSLGEAMGIAIGGAPTLRSAAGPNLILEFDCRAGSTGGLWEDQQQGVPLESPGSASSYEPDAGFFNDLPVHQTVAGSSRMLLNTSVPDLIPFGSKPELIMIARVRIMGAGTEWLVRLTDFPFTTPIIGGLKQAPGNRSAEFESGVLSVSGGDNDVHMWSVLYDTDGTPRFMIDGVEVAAGSPGSSTTVALGAMSVGGNIDGASCIDGSFAWIGLVSQQLTSAQRALVLAAAQSTFGF